jgi:hypothetical protein
VKKQNRRLVKSSARGAPKLGRRWLDEIMTGSIIDAGQLARRERCTARQINLTASLAFLLPNSSWQRLKVAYRAALTSSACVIR